MSLRAIASGVHVHEIPLRFFGVSVGARMTVLALDGGLLLHSPTDAPLADVEALGTPRWLLAPNNFHHLFAETWMDRGVAGWCAPGLATKRQDLPWSGVVDTPCAPFGEAVQLFPLTCIDFTQEVVLFHAPSKTLIVTDLLFNFTTEAPWSTRAVMKLAGAGQGPTTTLLERLGMNRERAREEIGGLLELDFDRLIPSHGAIIETGGREALQDAFSWLNP